MAIFQFTNCECHQGLAAWPWRPPPWLSPAQATVGSMSGQISATQAPAMAKSEKKRFKGNQIVSFHGIIV